MTVTVLYRNVVDDIIENAIEVKTLKDKMVQITFDENGRRMNKLIYLDRYTKVMISM